jgi:hypothetical protein
MMDMVNRLVRRENLLLSGRKMATPEKPMPSRLEPQKGYGVNLRHRDPYLPHSIEIMVPVRQ